MSWVVEQDRPFTNSDAHVVRECLEGSAPELFYRRSAIVHVQRSRFQPTTSYDAYVVTVRFSDGGDLRVFLKDFGFSLRPKNDPKLRREREVHVYRDLLRDAGLGTARYYGSVMDEAEGRLWLLLEYVDGTPVGYCDLGDAWVPAAEALGRMHGHFARHLDRLRASCDFLIQHDADLYWSTAERALTDVAKIAPRLVARVEDLVRRYSPIVTVMMAGRPVTLLHGGCRPSNVLIRVSPDPSRVCILDWEEAGLGAPLFDVAHLVDGIDSPLLDRLLDAYRRGAAAFGVESPPPEEMKHAVDCFRLHMAFDLLGRAVLKGYGERDVLKVLDYADRVGHGAFQCAVPSAAARAAPSTEGR